MTSEINGLPPIHRQISGSTNEQNAEQTQGKNSSAAHVSDQVSLTGTAQKLQALTDEVASLPEVDQSRVDAIKQAIAEGSYQIDANRIAEKMIQFGDSPEI